MVAGPKFSVGFPGEKRSAHSVTTWVPVRSTGDPPDCCLLPHLTSQFGGEELLRVRSHVVEADHSVALSAAHALVEVKQRRAFRGCAQPPGHPPEEPDQVRGGLSDIGVIADLPVGHVDGLVDRLVQAHLQLADGAIGAGDFRPQRKQVGPVRHCHHRRRGHGRLLMISSSASVS